MKKRTGLVFLDFCINLLFYNAICQSCVFATLFFTCPAFRLIWWRLKVYQYFQFRLNNIYLASEAPTTHISGVGGKWVNCSSRKHASRHVTITYLILFYCLSILLIFYIQLFNHQYFLCCFMSKKSIQTNIYASQIKSTQNLT